MNTQQHAWLTRWLSVVCNAVRPRQLVFIGIAVTVIALQLLAMDWVVSAQVDRARAHEAEHLSRAATEAPRTTGPGAVAASAGIPSDGA